MFFLELEISKKKIFVNFINPRCLGSMNTQLLRFNVFTQDSTVIDSIEYTLNGTLPGLVDVNNYCTGEDNNKYCQKLDDRIIPYQWNSIRVVAADLYDVNYTDCNFYFNPNTRQVIIGGEDNGLLYMILGVAIVFGAIVLLWFRAS